jgi:hypothetical protein
MKKHLFASLGLGLLLATTSAVAQTVNLRAHIPFNFVVAGKTLPNGEYTLRSVGYASIVISGWGQKPASFIANPWLSPQKGLVASETKLVFHRYGGQYFLAEIWMEGYGAGRQVPKSRREIEAARNDTGENVLVLADLR